MPEILSMSDRICVMREGELSHVLDPQQLNEETLLEYYMGIA